MKTTIIIFTFLFSSIGFLQAQEPVDTIWIRNFQYVSDANFTPDGSKLLVSDENGIYLLNTEDGELIHQYETFGDIEDLDISSDGSYFIGSDLYKRSLTNFSDVTSLNFSLNFLPKELQIDETNSRVLFATCNAFDENNRIRVFDLETLSPLQSIPLDICLDYIKVSNDGNHIAVYGFEPSEDGKYKLLLLDKDFNIVKEIFSSSESGVAEMNFSNDSESLYFISDDYYKYDLATENITRLTYVSRGYNDFVLSKDDQYIISNFFTNKDNLKVINTNDFEDERIFNLGTRDVWDIDSKGFIACGNHRNMYLVNLFSILSVDKDNNNSFQVYPNPFNDQLTITNIQCPMTNVQCPIEILDIMGNVVHQEELTLHSSLYTLNLEALLPGTYFVKIGDRVEKVVKR